MQGALGGNRLVVNSRALDLVVPAPILPLHQGGPALRLTSPYLRSAGPCLGACQHQQLSRRRSRTDLGALSLAGCSM